MNRRGLAEQFRIEIKNPDAQAVLVSMVTQMLSGEVGELRGVNASREQVMSNNFVGKTQEPSRTNSFIAPPVKEKTPPMASTQDTIKTPTPLQPVKQNDQSSSELNSLSSVTNGAKGSSISAPSGVDNSVPNVQTSSEVGASLSVDTSNKPNEDVKANKNGKKVKKEKEEKEKAPEKATDLLGDVMGKFAELTKKSKDE